MANMNDKPFLADDNIGVRIAAKQAEQFDKLNLYHYAEVLSTFIEDCETPMTIGLQGDWGIGKSTLLNMLKTELNKKPSGYPIIEFNTWQYSLFGEDEYIGLSAINAMLNLLKAEFNLDEEEEGTLEKASSKVKAALKTIKFGFGPIKLGSVNEINEAENSALSDIPYVDISEQMKELSLIHI